MVITKAFPENKKELGKRQAQYIKLQINRKHSTLG